MIGAITIHPENGRISPVFETATRIRFFDCETGGDRDMPLPGEPEEKIELLARQGTVFLLCGAIANETAALLEARGIAVVSFLAGDGGAIRETWRTCRCELERRHGMPGCCRRAPHCPQKHHLHLKKG